MAIRIVMVQSILVSFTIVYANNLTLDSLDKMWYTGHATSLAIATPIEQVCYCYANRTNELKSG